MSAAEPQSSAEWQRRQEEQDDDDIRRRAGRARTEDEYLDVIREAGSLRAGLAIMGRSCAPRPASMLPAIPSLDVTRLTTQHLEQYERGPVDPVHRARYLADPVVAACLAELAKRRAALAAERSIVAQLEDLNQKREGRP